MISIFIIDKGDVRMKIVSVKMNNFDKNNIFEYEKEIAQVKNITSKMVMLDGKINYSSRYDKSSLDKIIFDNTFNHNDHSTSYLRLKIASLCEDNEVENTITRLKILLYDFAVEEIKRRKIELEELETAINNLQINN